MPATLITDITELVTNDETLGRGELGIISDAALVLEGDRVAWVGQASEAPACDLRLTAGGAVIPAFVDSHAHLVFSGDRANEFDSRMRGSKYEAGGIRHSVDATRTATDDELRKNVSGLASELHAQGVGHFESKTGYGLTERDELRSVAIAREFTPDVTLLAAHVIPKEYESNREQYVDLAASLAEPAKAAGARWVDVFCDRGAFTADEARKILSSGMAAGLQPRIHVNQLADIGGIELAVELDCASADHCSQLNDEQIELLAASRTFVTLLPGAEFSTRAAPVDARRLIDAGVKVALATDCNPGSSFTTSMPFVMAVAVREMGFTPAEALRAATFGGAEALRRQDLGRLRAGCSANLAMLSAPSYLHLTYRPGVPLIRSTWGQGKRLWPKPETRKSDE